MDSSANTRLDETPNAATDMPVPLAGTEKVGGLVVASTPLSVFDGRAQLPPKYYNDIAPFLSSLTCRQVTYNECLAGAIGLAGALTGEKMLETVPADARAIMDQYLNFGRTGESTYAHLDLANGQHDALVQTVKAFGTWNAACQVLVRKATASDELAQAAQALLAMAVGALDCCADAFEATVGKIRELLVGSEFESMTLVPSGDHLAALVSGQSRLVCELRGNGSDTDVACRVGPALLNKWGKVLPDLSAAGHIAPVVGIALGIFNALPTIEFGVRQPLMAIAIAHLPVRTVQTARHNFIAAYACYAQLALCATHEMPGQEQDVYEALCATLASHLDKAVAHIVASFANQSRTWFSRVESMARVYVACRELTFAVIKAVWQSACLAAPIHVHPACLMQHLTAVEGKPLPRSLFGKNENQIAVSAHAQLEQARAQANAGHVLPDKFRIRGADKTSSMYTADTPLLKVSGFAQAVGKLLGLEDSVDMMQQMECFGTIRGLYLNYLMLGTLNDTAARKPLLDELSDPVLMVRANQPTDISSAASAAMAAGDKAMH